jgi:alpha-1,3-rhamnosyl/mannosyltransferase
MTYNNLPIRVAYNTTSLLSPLTGVGQYTRNLFQELKLSNEVSMLNFYGLSWTQKDLTDVSFEMQINISRLKQVVKKYIPKSYLLVKKVQQIAFTLGEKIYKPDLYHETNFLPFNFSGPTVLTVHDLSWIRFPEMHPIERVRVFNKYFEPSLRQATRIITDSEFVKQELIDVFGLRAEVINAVALAAESFFQPLDLAQSLNKLLEKDLTYKMYWLAVGTLEPRKNLQLVLRAFMGLPKSVRQRCPLVIVGMTGWNFDSLDAELKTLVQSGEVRRLGYLSREDLAVVIAGTKSLIYPSVYEGFGLPLLEAMCCGVPVITSNVSSLPEVVGDAGILIDPKDVEGLMKQMQRLFDDETLCSTLGAAVLQRSYQFSWNKCAKDTVQVYRAALQ